MGNSNSTTQKPKKNVYSEIYDKHHLHNVEMDDDDTFASSSTLRSSGMTEEWKMQ